jgi:cytochrome P450
VKTFLVNHNQQILNRIANPRHLGRSKDYIDTCCEISDDFMLVGGVRGLPHILRPLVGSVMGIWFKTKIKKMKKVFEPLYRKRIAMLQHSADDPEHEEPNDYLQIMFRYAADRRQEELGSIDVMTRRLIIANFGSIHQPSLLIANTLLNIIDSDTEFNTIATLRDELINVFGIAPDGTTPDIADHRIWTKVNINRMNKADSLMRKTTRLHTFGSRAMLRKVMPKDGVTTDTGVHLPQGTLISFMAHPVQMDEETFDNPNKFDPFRFSRMREMMEAKKAEAKEPAGDASAETDEVAGVGPLKFVTTGPDHLTFGHGRHACPGRFVVDFQLKMIIAHVITRYELEFPKEYNGRRPENTWIADVKLPRHAKIRVRRKKLVC